MSAYRFVTHIKSYNIKSKYYRNIKKDIVYMGFPSSKMDTISERCSNKGYEVKEEESMITIDCQTDIAGYNVWKQEQRKSKLDNDKKIRNIDTQEDVAIKSHLYIIQKLLCFHWVFVARG